MKLELIKVTQRLLTDGWELVDCNLERFYATLRKDSIYIYIDLDNNKPDMYDHKYCVECGLEKPDNCDFCPVCEADFDYINKDVHYIELINQVNRLKDWELINSYASKIVCHNGKVVVS